MAHRLPLADIQFIADFAAYARSRGDVAYHYGDVRGCAVCQFLKQSGRAAMPLVGGTGWWDDDRKVRHAFPAGLTSTEEKCGAIVALPHTFSALADRLEALIADAPAVVRP